MWKNSFLLSHVVTWLCDKTLSYMLHIDSFIYAAHMHNKRKIDSNYCNSCLLAPVVTHLKTKKGRPNYSRMQIGWHRISRLFLRLFQRTKLLPMGFTISTTWWMALMNPMRILVVNWFFLERISRFCAILSAIGCMYVKTSVPVDECVSVCVCACACVPGGASAPVYVCHSGPPPPAPPVLCHHLRNGTIIRYWWSPVS